MNSFPQLFDTIENKPIHLTGRIVTVGSSSKCHICIGDNSIPGNCAHLLFTGGGYKVQSVVKSNKILVNDKVLRGTIALQHGDRLAFGPHTYTYFEYEPSPEFSEPKTASGMSDTVTPSIGELVRIVISLLRNKNEDVFADLVTSISRLLRCDASRLVGEDPETGERKTIQRYPSHMQLDRFSNRAIDWARDAMRTVIVHDTDWRDSEESMRSLERNLIGSILCAPLVEKGEIAGYLYLDRLRCNPSFTEKDRDFCDALVPLFSEILTNFKERQRQSATIARLQKQQLSASGGIIYESAVMAEMIRLATKLSRTNSPILVFGETGTGKELMARFIHNNSPRSGKPFKAINCGAIPDNLMESELFGHEKGAFTGASQRKEGLFEVANGGTVFLDEIGELPLHLQVKLLRILQESEVVRIGGNETIQVDVRIVAATNKVLEEEIAQGRFRRDLFFRLNVLKIHLPPLRERDKDVILLADFFLKRYSQQFGLENKALSATAQKRLLEYGWPGNIRELENVIQKAILLSEGNRIGAEVLSFESMGHLDAPSDQPSGTTLREVRNWAEQKAIENAMNKASGNVSMAARLLAIDRKWLMKKMDEYAIYANSFR